MVENKLDNEAPIIYSTAPRIERSAETDYDADIEDPIDAKEIFDLIRDINDPEHPLSLEQLNVVQEELIEVTEEDGDKVRFTPTIPHCSMATLIGLAIRIKLSRSVHPSVKVIVRITPGSHNTEDAINKQLADKERVAAAMENIGLMNAVNECLKPKDF
ncbi:unnamed protein product [Anisakis simplex]|uniref:MIP18 family protein (inferred by orthology to a C. elegans protein) n=1 Tax=Anisakis simplex TaxID=6269 RepID=A0A0M3J6X3_ANISI|nr:unnamed protein product [Anisakis simplex]